MFKQARIKLTVYYLAIIMAISVFFSLIIYKGATFELQRIETRQAQRRSIIGAPPIFDPEVIVLSGGISEAKKLIEPYIKEQLKKLVSSPEAQKTKILFTKIGYYGGALGAALLFEKDSL